MAAAWSARWRVGSLLLVTTLVWCAHYDRWTIADWRLPTDYGGDSPEILAQLKATAEGDMMPMRSKVIDRLGAPFGAHWNGYPTPDKLLMSSLGVLANVIGLFAAANAGLLLAQLSAALSFYFVARWLRVRWEWAWAGALLFAYTYHTFHRGLGHYSIAFPWTVPLGLLAVWLVAQSHRLKWKSGGAVVCLGAAFALGVSNPYNLFFWLQLMTWALVIQFFGERRRANLEIGFATLAVAVVAFVAMNIEVWLFVQEPDGLPLVARNYGGTEVYALKPMEMLIPPIYHRWSAMAFLGNRYVRWSDWRGEAFLPYLGIVGIAGLLWLAVDTFRRIVARRPMPGQALAGGWLVAYSTVGGLTNVAALVVGFQTFRATNRVAIFISALVMLYLMVRLSRLTLRWPAWTRLAVALLVAAIGVLDQVPKEASAGERAEIASKVNSDREFGHKLEDALPTGAMVFQLPVLGFPEVLPPFRLADYEHFRPFLTTDTLRFSYGAAKFRSRSRWQRDVENLPTAALVKRLERYGFAALYLNRKGFEDRGERLLNELAAIGYTEQIHGERGFQVAVLLHPRAKPELPLGRALTFGQGWHLRVLEGVRWANSDAVMSYFNPHDHPITVQLELSLTAPTTRDVVLQHQGSELKSVSVGEDPVMLTLPRLKLPPGVNIFTLHSRAPAVRLNEGRYQLRTFGLTNSSIKVVAGEMADAE